jgi:hypothetical protein
VGKSSLVEAVRWGLLGTPVDRARGRAVQAGHDEASVTVSVSLSGRGELEVTRTLRRGGAATFAARIDERSLTEASYVELLSEAWSAQPGLLDAVIFGPDPGSKTTGFPVRDHLAAVFGVEPLLRATTDMKQRRDELAAQIKLLRDDLSGTANAVESAQQEVTTLATQVEAVHEQRIAAETRLRDAESLVARAAAWRRYHGLVDDYRRRTEDLVGQMSAALGPSAVRGVVDPREALARVQQERTDAIQAAAEAIAQSDLRAARSANAAELLASATDECPTCLRPISEAERTAALRNHDHVSDEAGADRSLHQEQTRRAREQLAIIARFSTEFAQLHPPTEPDQADPGTAADLDIDEIRRATGGLIQRHGALDERLRAAERGLSDLQAAAADHEQLTRLATDDLLLEVTQRSLAATADRYLTERVEPLATEIAHRWKLLFGTEGLRFAPDGELSLGHADLELALTDLSGAERATALLITRIMLAASATRASTLWLDEPLEHLDPLRRAGVAQTLVRAAQTGTVGQILITTYEEGLARRLEASAPNSVELTYLRTTADPMQSV